MKKIMLLIFCLVLSNIIWSQIGANCIYKITINENALNVTSSDDKISRDTKNMLNNAFSLATRFEYTLEFNNNESIFQLNRLLIEDSKNDYLYPIAKAIIGQGIYYQNKIENENSHQLETSAALFLVKDTFISDWKITKEQKQIGKYLCFKAIKKCEPCDTADEVWFTPEISVPFGPLGYSGLPGLILEVKKKLFTLSLTSITFNTNDVEIMKPSKGKIVTIDEYKEITDSYRSQLKNK